MDPMQFWQTPTQDDHAPSSVGAATTPVSGSQEPVPGSHAPLTAAGPGGQEAPQQPGEGNAEYEDRLRQAEARAQQYEQEAQQLRGTFEQVQQWAMHAQRQQAEHARQDEMSRREAEIYQRAESMNATDAFRYIQEENRKLRDEINRDRERERMELIQREQMTRRTLATPLYIDHLVKQHGLPEEAKQELMAIGDPDVAGRIAPQMKARYDQYRTLQDQINQLSRSRQADQMQHSGLGMMGGTAPATGAPQPSGDPDKNAMRIYAELKQGTYQR